MKKLTIIIIFLLIILIGIAGKTMSKYVLEDSILAAKINIQSNQKNIINN